MDVNPLPWTFFFFYRAFALLNGGTYFFIFFIFAGPTVRRGPQSFLFHNLYINNFSFTF